jgi:hypothetical protein
MTSEVRRLHEMRAQNISTADIAKELSRTVDAVNSFLSYVPSFREQSASRKPIERRPPVEWQPELSPSERLRIATIQAIMAYASERSIDVDRAAVQLLYARAA